MKTLKALSQLAKSDQMGRYVFTRKDLAKYFPQDKPKAFEHGLARLVNQGFLTRACHGVYVNTNATSNDGYTLERIAKALRRGEYNYLSLESMLSEYGVISQVPLDRITVMTTGREGTYQTPFGTIEFTHTKRSVSDILGNILVQPNRPLRLATKKAAWRDLKRVGRNTHLVNQEMLNEE